jgi:hypothetical protein
LRLMPSAESGPVIFRLYNVFWPTRVPDHFHILELPMR